MNYKISIQCFKCKSERVRVTEHSSHPDVLTGLCRVCKKKIYVNLDGAPFTYKKR